jgi:enoyl-[acyl-carrier protein] reductase/trans-2-enoyl-CoA reductase (NAD+)
MIIKPKVRGFICTNAHPTGCEANVQEQISYIQSKTYSNTKTPKNVLVIGCSTGYGLASRITAAFGYGANTLGVCFEKAPTDKLGSAGYYNTAAFQALARKAGLKAETLNGDAFSQEMKHLVIDHLKKDFGPVDLVVYSLASPRRTDPVSGETFQSVLKPVGKAITSKNLNTDTRKVGEITIEPASAEEIAQTVKVMGGEDWELWIEALIQAGVLAEGVETVAYTYLGDKLTWPIYGQATIGKAKEDLDRASKAIAAKLSGLKGNAHVAVLKALVTQASSAIPLMSLYLSILIRVMKAAGTNEHCIEQIDRLFSECIYSDQPRLDDQNRFRVDELELDPAIQREVERIWDQVNDENLDTLTDFAAYQADFLKLFGFGIADIDYDAEVGPEAASTF